MDRSASSKVTVEYHDPDGIFPLLSSHLATRLPLRNLHWKAPTRPLRSIDSLHIDLVSADGAESLPEPLSAVSVASDVSSQPPGSSSGKREDGLKVPSKERRHQIPGLRQTPYLKLYLLRCDDSDQYKAHHRKLLREWIKAHGTPSSTSSTSSEKHDAFEWIILHVVLPNTAASGQPRWSGTSRDSASGPAEKSSGTSRWPGRSSGTIYEKIRADFNSSSKSAPDHVAQIRLPKEGIPEHQLPPANGTVVPPYTETAQEQDHAWSDLIAKLKSLILLSFDQRVSQYEEDIRVKDSQRALAGWNFCTFFVLKEGLARGFENVGLVEDALVMYDELSVGLDAVIRDQADGSEGRGGSFLEYTGDLADMLASVLAGDSTVDSLGQKPIDAGRKSYRELILSTNISVFDFKCYVFARQMTLLLRLGNAHSARTDLISKLMPGKTLTHQKSRDDMSLSSKSDLAEAPEDLAPLSELCERVLRFVTSVARDMRLDLWSGVRERVMSNARLVVDNLIYSWSYDVLQQVLDETKTSALPITMLRKSMDSDSVKLMPMKEPKVSVPEPKTMIHPARSTSLSNRRNSLSEPPYAVTPQSGQVVYDHGSFPSAQSGRRQEDSQRQNHASLQELAALRAEIYLVQRRIIEQIGKSAGWNIGWTALTSAQSVKNEDLSDVVLDNSDEATSPIKTNVTTNESNEFTSRGILATELVTAIESVHKFRSIYESLCDMAFRHYMAATRTKAAESIFGDLAALKYQVGDYTAAAMYFSKMAPLFAQGRWNFVEMTMLKMYGKCLKELHRKGDYINALLDILAKSAARWRGVSLPRIRLPPANKDQSKTAVWLNDDAVDTTGFLTELIDVADQVSSETIAPMSRYFDKISIDPYPRPYDDKDGFQLCLNFRHLLEDTITIDRFKVRLVNASSNQSKELWLEKNVPVEVARGAHKVWVDSNVTSFGTFVVDTIQLEAKKLRFVHEPLNKSESTTPLGLATSVSAAAIRVAKKSRILCYPGLDSFYAKTSLTRNIHIDKPRSIILQCRSGRNDISQCEIRLRSATAGLRLRTADTTLVSDKGALDTTGPAGVLTLSDVPSGTQLDLRVPYDVEIGLPEITIRMEATYKTPLGVFVWLSSATIPIELPLDVNVHDHFKAQTLFSKFHIKTATNNPLEVLDVNLEGTEAFEVGTPSGFELPMLVFQKQPACLTYKVTPLQHVRQDLKEQPLSLTVDYRCFEEDVCARIEHIFTKSLADSPFAFLTRLLVPAIIERLQQVLASQYEKIALLGRVHFGSFADLGLDEYIENLPPAVQPNLTAWLSDWHKKHSPMPLSAQNLPPELSTARRIIITAPIPRLQLLATASLEIKTTSSVKPSQSSPPLICVGQPLAVTLRITHTRRWDAPVALQRIAHLESPNDPIRFLYEFSVNPDLWLISGSRRAQFSAKEDEEKSFEIVLVPLKQGTWLLPSVEVRLPKKPSKVVEDQHRSGRDTDDAEEIACETDFTSQGETVLVVGDMRQTTVGITGLGTSAGTVLVDALDGT